MELTAVEALAHQRLKEHNLLHVRFKWDNSAYVFGHATDHMNRYTGVVLGQSLTLSRRLMRTNDYDVVNDVILHEIAHLLVGHKAAHGPTWQEMCRRVGAVPQACKRIDGDVVKPPTGGYHGHCVVCGGKRWRARRPTRNMSCGQCGQGAYNPQFLIVWEKGA